MYQPLSTIIETIDYKEEFTLPRHARQKSSTNIYHVVVKGADRQLLFEEKKDYLKYLRILEYYKYECEFKIYAYCLMSNHIHLLIHHSENTSLSTIFRKINTTYACWFNAKYNRTGYLQNDRFYSEPVETEKYLLSVVKYIHFNPTKAGLENSPGEKYPWSSFYDYRSSKSKLTDIDFILEILGNRDIFITQHRIVTDEKCLDINTIKRRLPDDVARDIIQELCDCNTSTDFQNLPINQRNNYLIILYKKGISVRQLNRLTGIPRGIIDRVLSRNSLTEK